MKKIILLASIVVMTLSCKKGWECNCYSEEIPAQSGSDSTQIITATQSFPLGNANKKNADKQCEKIANDKVAMHNTQSGFFGSGSSYSIDCELKEK